MAAVCHCCGSFKKRPLVQCKHCGVIPIEEDREVAWLLSEEYLSVQEQELASKRIQKGEVLRPSRKLRRISPRLVLREGLGPISDDSTSSCLTSKQKPDRPQQTVPTFSSLEINYRQKKST